MYFIKYNPDTFDTIHQAIHPFDEKKLNNKSHLSLNYSFYRKSKNNVGLFNAQNLSWAVLESDEAAIINILNREKTLRVLHSELPHKSLESIKDLILTLYARGLINIDGKPYIGNHIFDNGVMYHHTYLIELLLTERCNLRCTYCFAEVDNRKKLMGEDIAKKILDKVLKIETNRMMVEFSGGEVFLNYKTFKYCVEYLEKNKGKKSIQYSAQTNATLLNEEILAFCKEFKVHLSLTLDGPKEIHDAQRINWNKKGTYDQVINSISLLNKHDIPFGVIGVVTANSLNKENEIMQHYQSLGIRSVKLNHCTPQGYSKEVWDDIGIDGNSYLKFMTNIYQWIKENNAAVRESNLEVFFLNFISKTSQYRCTRTSCRAGFEFLVFDPDGDIFPCPRYKHNPETHLGNVNKEQGLVDQLYLKNELVKGIDRRNVNKIPLCNTCQWKNACRGGCSLETYEAFHTLDRESGICSFYKGIYPFLFEKLIEDPEFIATYILDKVILVKAELEEKIIKTY